jgi:enterobactin synthetase component D
VVYSELDAGMREVALPALWGIAAIRQRIVVLPVQPHVSGATARQCEFHLGRAIAAAMLREEGSASEVVGVGEDRAPQWPAGFIGTISHSSALLGVATARQESLNRELGSSHGPSGIGMDIEPLIQGTSLDDVRRFCLCDDERRACRSLGAAMEGWGVTTIFSAKEALFKCLYPIVRTFFDFCDVSIDLAHLGNGRIDGRLKRTLSSTFPVCTTIPGRCRFAEQHVITAFHWPEGVQT